MSPMPKEPVTDSETGKVLPRYMQPTSTSWAQRPDAWVKKDEPTDEGETPGGSYSLDEKDPDQVWKVSLRSGIDTRGYDPSPRKQKKTIQEMEKDLAQLEAQPPPPPFFGTKGPGNTGSVKKAKPSKMIVTLETVCGTPCGLGLTQGLSGETVVYDVAKGGQA